MSQSVEEAFLSSAPTWMLDSPEWLYSFFYDFFKAFIYDDRYLLMLTGLGNTLQLTFFSLILGIILGIVVALVRVSWDTTGKTLHEARKSGASSYFRWFFLALANGICKVYLTVIRGTPVMIQILIIFFVFLSSADKMVVGTLAFGINSGAYVAEIIRSGIMSVDKGQTEAGRSLGFGYISTMRFIVVPQAFKTVLPALANEFIVLLKETAVAGYIGMTDLTYAANTIAGTSFSYFYPLFGAALIYLAMVMFFTWIVGKLERRMRNSER